MSLSVRVDISNFLGHISANSPPLSRVSVCSFPLTFRSISTIATLTGPLNTRAEKSLLKRSGKVTKQIDPPFTVSLPSHQYGNPLLQGVR